MAARRGSSAVGVEDDDESPAMDKWPSELTKMSSSLSEGPASNMMRLVLSDSREVLEAFPSHLLSMALRPHRGDDFTVEVPTAALWEQTMGRLLRAGRWVFEDQRKLSTRYASALRRQLAVLHTQARPRINSFLQDVAGGGAQAQQEPRRCARCPTGSSESSSSSSSSSSGSNAPDLKAGPEDEDGPPDNVSTRVGGVYHETLAVHIPPRNSVPLLGSLVGTCWLHVRGDRRSEELVSSCVLQVFGEGRGALPTFVAGRHGRVDTPGKAQQLFELIRFAVGQSRPPREQLRVRVLSLLNALVVDRQERTFFQNQLAALAAPSADFAKAMGSLGADFACLNFVANWPLGLRLGTGPPCGQHNALHPRGLQRHLRWLAQDVLSALGGSSTRERPLRELSEGRSALDPWREGLPAVQAAISALRARGEHRQECCRLFMAAELLAQLCKCEGATFRRRAGELLQLCLLEHLLGVVPFFNCKSGIDRTGLVVALWTTVEQLLPSTRLWLWYYLALTYPVLVKIVHGLHGCGDRDARGRRGVPCQQLREGCALRGTASLLPFPPEAEDRDLYSDVERLCTLVGGQTVSDAESRTFEVLERLFFSGPDALLPKLQTGFLANVLGVATKIAVASTGVHGLKYGENKSGQCNALAAQFMPRRLCCGEGNASVDIAAPRRGLVATDVAFTAEVLPYLVGSSAGRGT